MTQHRPVNGDKLKYIYITDLREEYEVVYLNERNDLYDRAMKELNTTDAIGLDIELMLVKPDASDDGKN